jgi:hypothetical protein
MPLAQRLANRPHTVRTFRAAAGARYRDGLTLAGAGRPLGAVYLFGYAAEMLLKAAYFRLRGWGPGAITYRDLADARARALGTHGVVWPGRLHDLGGWSRLLVAERAFLGRPLPARLGRQAVARVALIYRHWRETLRYYDAEPYAGEVVRTRAAVAWLFDHFRYL